MATVACSCAFGSSPRIWGTHRPGAELRVDLQFISTYVGNSRTQAEPPTRTPVHPHMRGELTFPDRIVQHAVGSSPHTWGTRPVIGLVAAKCRFIPTYVGNSGWCSPRGLRHAVHPHMRGELYDSVRGRTDPDGSSPHAWGTPESGELNGPSDRFIPTCVGNSWESSCTTTSSTVHPHMRGELLADGRGERC